MRAPARVSFTFVDDERRQDQFAAFDSGAGGTTGAAG
jgi:hypothetical protein